MTTKKTIKTTKKASTKKAATKKAATKKNPKDLKLISINKLAEDNDLTPRMLTAAIKREKLEIYKAKSATGSGTQVVNAVDKTAAKSVVKALIEEAQPLTAQDVVLKVAAGDLEVGYTTLLYRAKALKLKVYKRQGDYDVGYFQRVNCVSKKDFKELKKNYNKIDLVAE